MDSIVIAASASPEGTVQQNNRLAKERAASVAAHFDGFIRHWRDSVRRSSFSLSIGEDGQERRVDDEVPDIRFVSRSKGENWPYLAVLVDEDTLLTESDKRSFVRLLSTADPDEREHALQGEPYYRHLREELYPRLRTVRFDFHLHRKGMIKDTVHTTELDTVYMKGVEYLREREYEKALSLLREYRDYNTAIAYVSLDYNASAMSILQELERTPQVSYMLALLYARSGDDSKAVQCYLDACRQEHSFVFRGNLDPEIYVLIQRYGLNKEDENANDISS
jgi:tetratricopeptide (TPR) repeat protein